jgi:hypothetical protein
MISLSGDDSRSTHKLDIPVPLLDMVFMLLSRNGLSTTSASMGVESEGSGVSGAGDALPPLEAEKNISLSSSLMI